MKRLSQRKGKGGAGEVTSEGGPEIISFAGVSVQLLLDVKTAVEDGTAAPRVRLFVAKVGISSSVKEGATIKLVGSKTKWFGKMQGTVAYVDGTVAFRADQVREKARSDWTTEDVAEHVVLAATSAKRCIYVEEVEDRADVGPEYKGAFVSHARSCSFASLVTALARHFERRGVDMSHVKTQFVWIDVFSANQALLMSQHSDPRVRQERCDLLTKGLHEAIDKFDEHVIFIDKWDDPAPLRRGWCVWEMHGSIRHGKEVQPVFAPEQDVAFLIVLLRDVDATTQTTTQTVAEVEIDARKAVCSRAEDEATIAAAVESQLNDGFASLNASILASRRDWLAEITHATVARAKVLYTVGVKGEMRRAHVLQQAGYFLGSLAMHGQHDEALAYFEEALSIHAAVIGEQHPFIADTLGGIASVYRVQGRYEEALTKYQKALDILKEALIVQGQLPFAPDEIDVTSTLDNIAGVYNEQGKYEEALAYLDEALLIRKAKLGKQHLNVAATLVNIGRVYSKQGRHDEALDLLEQSLQMRQDELGERHGDVAESLACTADVLTNQGRFEEALDFYARALDIATEALPSRNALTPLILHGTAEVHEALGNRPEALRLFRQACDLRKDLLGDAHPDTLATQAALDDLADQAP